MDLLGGDKIVWRGDSLGDMKPLGLAGGSTDARGEVVSGGATDVRGVAVSDGGVLGGIVSPILDGVDLLLDACETEDLRGSDVNDSATDLRSADVTDSAEG